MTTILVTGGSGFFGQILLTHLLESGYRCLSVDVLPQSMQHEHLIAVLADVRDTDTIKELVKQYDVRSAVHCAALLAHVRVDERDLNSVNVDGTRSVAEAMSDVLGASLVFISTNCLWASGFDQPVAENETPRPIEAYGRSKLQAETLLLTEYVSKLRIAILRTPTIVDAGRVGLLAILFEFVREGRRVWCVGRGENRYQFLFAVDLADACLRAVERDAVGIYHVGSDHVDTLAGVYRALIKHAGTRARVASVPKWLVLPTLAALSTLRLSPLGPYQYRMISESFVFDTSRAKRELGWKPTLTNADILIRAYDAYFLQRDEMTRSDEAGLSPHRRPASFGILRLVKWLS